ncbi:hypothetical protein ACFWGI_08220 [Streptomyces niveus]|uniref:hypothetical protein n=1 Tax=Streptomyces niveus TaxID=193462 RepID=UPI0036693D97
MFLRRSKRRDAGGLRAKFVANRDKVRAWTSRWECPEVEWPTVSAIPLPWLVMPGGEEQWLDIHAPFMDAYQWHLEARPVADGVGQLQATWEFGAGHEFRKLTIRFRSVYDPGYLAEKLSLGIQAAALKGWQDDDRHSIYNWLCEGLDEVDPGSMVRGNHRSGFLLSEFRCSWVNSPEVTTEVATTITNTSLNGAPLDADGKD